VADVVDDDVGVVGGISGVGVGVGGIDANEKTDGTDEDAASRPVAVVAAASIAAMRARAACRCGERAAL
jgi:hypothetical protein